MGPLGDLRRPSRRSRSMKKRAAAVALGFLISALCIWMLLRSVDRAVVGQALRSVGWGTWLTAGGIYLVSFIPRGWRWAVMLEPVGRYKVTDTFRAVVIGYTANNLLPFRLGEFVRAVVFNRMVGVSRVTALASVAAERLLDGTTLAIVLLAAVSFAATTAPSKTLTLVSVAGAGLVGAAVAGLVTVLFLQKPILALAAKIPRFPRPVLERIFAAGDFLRSPRRCSLTAALSMMTWFIEGLVFVWVADRMGLGNPWLVGFLSLAVVNLGILLPSAPGYVGVFQVAAVAAFLTLGLEESIALAFALVIHSAQFLPLTLLGCLLAPAVWTRDLLKASLEPTHPPPQ